MSNPDLVDQNLADPFTEFRRLAGQHGDAWSFDFAHERYRRTPERAARVARVARMNAVAAELNKRAPPQALLALLEDPERDVRA